ncbi:carbohydrate kinase family protein [Variovorax sp. JS1663]|uniref:carbohydrate kinase family protein n=1 Tax=Variovorax sp. JS1663 TaxID=1851577 RepID=UPI000B34821D|nr:carbohydrate kinase [Variovorax sp. JS1663]OUM02823.1 fructokinase [Variovorax sp. JS1663]
MFVVCGEALMDVYVLEATATGLRMDARIGGSPFNVAVGLARLGRRAALLTGLSRDAAGERLVQALAAEGVDPRLVVRSDAPSTLSVVSVDAAGMPHYTFYGHGTADRAIHADNLPALPAEARVLQFGSYALVVEPTGSALRALAARERGRRLVAYDPNVRLNVEPDLARWRQTVEAMAALAHIVKVSDEDLERLYPGSAPGEVARGWLAAGAHLVVLTRGAQGSEAWTHRLHATEAAVPVTVVDAVGAGDTFQAALLTWLDERGALSTEGLAALDAAGLAALLRFASRAAAITCSRRGADMPRRAELD